MNELLKNNPQFKHVLKNHMIPVDILSGLYENFYDTFVEERAKLIFNKLNDLIISKQEILSKKFVVDIKKSSSYAGTITIWGFYKKQKATAVFNIDLQQVLYNGNKYSVSASANIAKMELGAADSVSTNGWNWWKYLDKNAVERKIKDYQY